VEGQRLEAGETRAIRRQLEKMSTEILIAYPLRRLTGGLGKVEGEGRTLGELIDAIELRFPGIKAAILSEEGKILQHLHIFLNEVDAQTLRGLDTPLHYGDRVAIIPAIAGGCDGSDEIERSPDLPGERAGCRGAQFLSAADDPEP